MCYADKKACYLLMVKWIWWNRAHLKGELIHDTKFNDIINIGTVENPVYFAEKYIIEADFYVIIYYDAKGKILRKQIFTEEAEYEKIYCG